MDSSDSNIAQKVTNIAPTPVSISSEQIKTVQNLIAELLASYEQNKDAPPPSNAQIAEDIIGLLGNLRVLSPEQKEEIKVAILSTLDSSAIQTIDEPEMAQSLTKIEEQMEASSLEDPEGAQTDNTENKITFDSVKRAASIGLRVALGVTAAGVSLWFGGPYCAIAARGLYMSGYHALFGVPGFWAQHMYVLPSVEWAGHLAFTYGPGFLAVPAAGIGAFAQETLGALASGTGFILKKTADGLTYTAHSVGHALGIPGNYGYTDHHLLGYREDMPSYKSTEVDLNDKEELKPDSHGEAKVDDKKTTSELEEDWLKLDEVEFIAKPISPLANDNRTTTTTTNNSEVIGLEEDWIEISSQVKSIEKVAAVSPLTSTDTVSSPHAAEQTGWWSRLGDYLFGDESAKKEVDSKVKASIEEPLSIAASPPYTPSKPSSKQGGSTTKDDVGINYGASAKDMLLNQGEGAEKAFRARSKSLSDAPKPKGTK